MAESSGNWPPSPWSSVVNGLRSLAVGTARVTPRVRGKWRALRAIDAGLRRVAPRALPLRLLLEDVTYELNTRDLIDFNIACLGGHDRHVVDVLSCHIGSRDAVLWDVGANVGAITLPLARRHARLCVEAFEPSPPVVMRLRRNVALNPSLAGRIRVHEAALCDRVGTVDFFPSAEPGNSGVGTLACSHNTQCQPIRVTAYTGDHVIEAGAAAPPDVIKLDVEGFEYEVLMGLRACLTERAGLLVVFEHEPYRLRARGVAAPTLQLLRDLRFSLFAVSKSALEPLQPAMLESHQDVVALRTGSRTGVEPMAPVRRF